MAHFIVDADASATIDCIENFQRIAYSDHHSTTDYKPAHTITNHDIISTLVLSNRLKITWLQLGVGNELKLFNI